MVRKKIKVRSADANIVKVRTERNGLGALKTLFVVILIVVQLAVILCLYFYFISFFRWYLLISLVLSLITCVYVLSTDKNGQSKAVWILFLLVGFSVGYILYFLSDEHIFFWKDKKRYKLIYEKTYGAIEKRDISETDGDVKINCEYLKNVGGFQSFTNTDVKYFSSGAQLFDNILERLESACKFIFIEYFIIADGVLLERISEVLERKAAEGVDIRIIYDDMGSHGTFSRKTKKRLISAGIKTEPFNRLIPWFSIGLNYRDHRKIIVVDGETAYTGGSNLADEYINEKRMYGYWKDTGIRLDGTAADVFTLMFLRQWEFITKKEQEYDGYFGLAKKTENKSVVTPYADGLDYSQAIGKSVYINIMAKAKKRIYIMTPYFVPDETITNILANQALAGVDVRIVLPDIADKKYVYSVSRDNAERLIDAGVKVYCLKNSFVHSKIVLSENQASVGSINIDLRSFYQQFECAVLTDDKNVLSDIFADFENTFPDCFEITESNRKKNNIYHRITAGVLRLFAPLM